MWVTPGRETDAGDPTLETIGPINGSHLLWTVDLQTGELVMRKWINKLISSESTGLEISFTYIALENQYQLFASREHSGTLQLKEVC